MVVLLMLLSTVAVKIFPSDPTTVHKAIGSRVILGCHFTWEDMDHGPLEVEWTLKFDLHKEDPTILLYTSDKLYSNFYFSLLDRVYFNFLDPSQADKSVIIEGIKRSDAGTYQYQMKKVPGTEHWRQYLHLMVAPCLPSCTVEGTTYIGSDAFLKCQSNGPKPIFYYWNKINGQQMLVSISVDHGDGSFTSKYSKSTLKKKREIAQNCIWFNV
uniref:Immunoglobulin V-set domain-containing protein n=1 Tax=Electrophorus electricus TaxID=8005 RepID=A0A4W4F9U7_ELEEL